MIPSSNQSVQKRGGGKFRFAEQIGHLVRYKDVDRKDSTHSEKMMHINQIKIARKSDFESIHHKQEDKDTRRSVFVM